MQFCVDSNQIATYLTIQSHSPRGATTLEKISTGCLVKCRIIITVVSDEFQKFRVDAQTAHEVSVYEIEVTVSVTCSL